MREKHETGAGQGGDCVGCGRNLFVRMPASPAGFRGDAGGDGTFRQGSFAENLLILGENPLASVSGPFYICADEIRR